MKQKSSRISSTLAALAALAVAAAAVLAVNGSGLLTAQSTPAATIDLLNVGLCVTTDDSVFKESDCDDELDDNEFTVGDRDEIVERDTVYATYAHDPKSASEQPRAILTNSDLIKVSITDKGRDRRRSVLFPAAITATTNYGALFPGGDDDPVVKKIQELIAESDFAAKLSDEDQIDGFDRTNTHIYQPSRTGNAVIVENSGNHSFNFIRTGGDTTPFEPLSNDEVNDVVIFFGFSVNEPSASSGTKLTDVNDATKARAKVSELTILGAGSNNSLIADEDRNSGGGDVPPWLSVLANVPNGKDLVVVAVLYETSDEEVILGGAKCGAQQTEENTAGTVTNLDRCKPNPEQAASEPVYTKSEIDNRQALVARVQGDNGYQARNLYLKEEGRFSGRYTGYIRITDANGNGTADGDSTDRDWGRLLKDATGETAEDDKVAVIGVQDGPATITYKDSQGANRTLNIAIDIQPPTITIASPVHDSSGDDRSPDFVGTFEDGGAGLADDTFKLYVDNKSDVGEGAIGDSLADTTAVLEISTDLYGVKEPPNSGRYLLRRSYMSSNNYATPFGVIAGTVGNGIYFDTTGDDPEASETDNDAERKIVNADIYDDGDGQGTFDDDARFEGTATNGREIEVDFQAVVIDLAGNIGFSDSDTASPQFLNDWGTLMANRKDRDDLNVLGVFSRHVINLDDKDPEFMQDNTVTGFYGLDSDDEPVPHRRGIMITFDNDVSPDNITTSTFTVELDDKTNAVVDDVIVDGKLVFLRLTSDLGSSETPSIAIASGQRVEDFAGNQLQAREVKAFDAKDGVPPVLTVSLSNGSGTGEGNESSESLTRNTILVSVSSDEEIQGAPYVAVLCSNFNYAQPPATTRKDVDDFASDRSGPLTPGRPSLVGLGTPRCGTGSGATQLVPTETQMYSRAGLNWQYEWQNLGAPSELPQGELRVVVYARDRSTYRIKADLGTANTQNWGSTTTKFTYDTTLEPLVKGSTVNTAAGSVIPRPGQDVSSNPPIIVLDYTPENTQVTIEKLEVDDIDVTTRVSSNQRNRFVYQPEGLNLGLHKVEVDAKDAAGNSATFRYEFNVVTRSPFVMQLQAGWNSISLPQHPVDGTLESVFSNPAIDQVLSYDASDPEFKWRMATRQDGVWTTSLGELTNISAELGYWVNSREFVSQSVLLRGRQRLGDSAPLTPLGPSRYKGWNFVGVVDNDGDQTQNNWEDGLKLGDVGQTARMYLGSDFVEAYTWNATLNQFSVIEASDQMLIGQGIWVYYREGDTP